MTDENSSQHNSEAKHRADYSVQRDQQNVMNGPNKFKVGIFGANVSTGQGGLNFAENTIKLDDWSEVEGLAQKADRYGLEAFIPIARWQGLAGSERPWGRQFETLTWAAGLAAATENIHIFSTCHMPFFHPVMAAKMATTIDHISSGRMGLNAVAGYHRPEYKMFGLELPEHDKRYELADEWMTIVKRLWSDEEEFDFNGDFFNLEGAQAHPKPVQSPGPVVMSAGSSPAGQDFAFKHANILFAGLTDVESADSITSKIQANAKQRGREDLGLWAGVHIVCKDTEREAREYVEYLEEKADWESALRFKQIIEKGDARTFDFGNRVYEDIKQDESVRRYLRAGLVPIAGTPEMIVDSLLKLSEAGISGICTGLVDHDEGLDRMNEQIFPLMRSAGLRA